MRAAWILLLAVSGIAQKPQWVPVFADEFEGTELDLGKWSPHDPLRKNWATGEVTVSNGQLHLTQGAAVSTFGLFARMYGKFEIRCRGAGRVRLLPVPLSSLPAIEVFENRAASAKFLFGNYWGTEQTERSYETTIDGPDLTSGFHVITVEWDADRISWLIDGTEKFRSRDGVPRQSMFLLIDMQGDVDYVRAYRKPD